VQRRELDEGLQPRNELVVDERRLAQLTAVYNTVCNGVGRDEVVDRLRFLALDDTQLEARRARVDDKDPQPGQTQSRISGGSSPCSRP
jgi:hypothetical protein